MENGRKPDPIYQLLKETMKKHGCSGKEAVKIAFKDAKWLKKWK